MRAHTHTLVGVLSKDEWKGACEKMALAWSTVFALNAAIAKVTTTEFIAVASEIMRCRDAAKEAMGANVAQARVEGDAPEPEADAQPRETDPRKLPKAAALNEVILRVLEGAENELKELQAQHKKHVSDKLGTVAKYLSRVAGGAGEGKH